MAFCKSCGADIGEGKFCSTCGTAQEDGSTNSSTNTSEATSTPVSPTPPVYSAPVYSTNAAQMPNSSGQTVFSIINLAVGVILCCCSYGVSIIPLVLGIIALVFSSQAKKAQTVEEAQQKIKTAKILNIIAVAVLAIAVIVSIIVLVALGSSAWYSNILEDAGYSYSY